MSEQKVTRSLIVTDPSGVHVRTASAIQAIARRSQSEVVVVSAYHKAKGTDIWDLLALAAPQGSTITLEVAGPDALEVARRLGADFHRRRRRARRRAAEIIEIRTVKGSGITAGSSKQMAHFMLYESAR